MTGCALKKAKKKLITQHEAAEELGLSVRHVKRLLYRLKKHGDKAVVHGLRGRPSNRKIEENMERKAVQILAAPVYEGFGPTLAAEYLGNEHGIEASKETVRQWMMRAKLWRGKKAKVKGLWCKSEIRSDSVVLLSAIEKDSGYAARAACQTSGIRAVRPASFPHLELTLLDPRYQFDAADDDRCIAEALQPLHGT